MQLFRHQFWLPPTVLTTIFSGLAPTSVSLHSWRLNTLFTTRCPLLFYCCRVSPFSVLPSLACLPGHNHAFTSVLPSGCCVFLSLSALRRVTVMTNMADHTRGRGRACSACNLSRDLISLSVTLLLYALPYILAAALSFAYSRLEHSCSRHKRTPARQQRGAAFAGTEGRHSDRGCVYDRAPAHMTCTRFLRR